VIIALSSRGFPFSPLTSRIKHSKYHQASDDPRSGERNDLSPSPEPAARRQAGSMRETIHKDPLCWAEIKDLRER